jgi:hypothetical protein
MISRIVASFRRQFSKPVVTDEDGRSIPRKKRLDKGAHSNNGFEFALGNLVRALREIIGEIKLLSRSKFFCAFPGQIGKESLTVVTVRRIESGPLNGCWCFDHFGIHSFHLL